MNNELIFGKDPQQNIVNLTLKDEALSIYTETADGVKCEIFDYKPWVLTHKAIKDRSERLEGNQYWKYLTETSCEKFLDAQEKWDKSLWMPRQIEECAMLREGLTYYKGMKVSDVSILSFDIESSGLRMDETSRVFCISNTFRKNGHVVERRLFSIDKYPNEREMITDWCDWVRKVDPSIICGHNILGYDFPYLSHCYNDELDLGRDCSPAKFAIKPSKFRKDGSQQYLYNNVRIAGREVIDTFFLSMKYDIAREFPSYGLKPIVKHLGLEKEGRTFIDASKIAQQWENLELREKIKQYAIEDSEDALKLFDKMIPASFYLAQSVPMSLQEIVNKATGSYINNFMVRSYLQDGHSIAATSQIREHLEGGISFGIPGLYRNMAKIDLKSAYPSQILRFKLYDKQKDPKAYFYEMVKYFTYERFDLQDQFKKTKDQYFKDREQSGKTFINSAYGTLSTNYLNYNSPDLAAKITYETRECIDFALKWASGKDKHYWIQIFKEKTGQLDV